MEWPTPAGASPSGPLPAGDYLVTGVLDQNQNLRQDGREAYGSGRLARGKSDVGQLWAFVHDTNPPRIQTVTADDSVSATVAFTQMLDPRQRLTPKDARLRLLPDSTPVTITSLLPKPVDDSLHGRAAAPDTTAADTLETRDSLAPGKKPARGPTPRPERNEVLTGRPPLFDRLTLRVPRPWAPGSRLVLEIRGIRNVTGVARYGRGCGRRPGAAQGHSSGHDQEARGARLDPEAASSPPSSASPSSAEIVMDQRRELPSVDRLLHQPGIQQLMETAPRSAVVAAVRESLDAARTRRAGPPERWEEDVRERLAKNIGAGLVPVLNATGVVLHTNLGRAPLAESAMEAMTSVAQGYSNLELDLPSGARGSRSDHCRGLLRATTGADDALVVNNAAGALVLALNAVAEGRDVVISRGELIEIGGSFRIPDIMAKSGARLREIGTTNRTHLQDYRDALDGAAAILTVHRSNFEQRGFVTSPRAR